MVPSGVYGCRIGAERHGGSTGQSMSGQVKGDDAAGGGEIASLMEPVAASASEAVQEQQRRRLRSGRSGISPIRDGHVLSSV